VLSRHRLDQRLRPRLGEGAIGSHDCERENRAVGYITGLVREPDALDSGPFPELVGHGRTHLLLDPGRGNAGPAISE